MKSIGGRQFHRQRRQTIQESYDLNKLVSKCMI